jgi:hypothetical protein
LQRAYTTLVLQFRLRDGPTKPFITVEGVDFNFGW